MNLLGVLTLDIETIPSQSLKPDPMMVKVPANYKDEAKILAYQETHAEEAYRKLSLDPLWCQVVALSAAYGDDGGMITAGEDEKKIFTEFDNWLGALADMPKTTKDLIKSDPSTYTIVGFNHAEFDIPIIHLRAQKYRCRNIQKLLSDLKPFSDRIADVMRMAFPTAKNRYVSMDSLCEYFGIKGKGDMDGSMVYDYFLEGRLAEIAEYCQADVKATRELYKILTH